MVNIKSIEISQYISDKKDKRSHTYYRIEVCTSFNRVFFVDKRYKEFEALHNELKKTTDFESIKHIVEFPKPHFYTSSHKIFEFRRTSLNSYIKNLVQFYRTNYPIELIKFLNLDEATLKIDSFQEFSNKDESLNIPHIGIKSLAPEDIFNSIHNDDYKEDIILRGILKAFYS
ncbi:unnamed protein product [Brachionus calyciflorus]|uniref:PX domain-containing protein n=1 Tax=Brachionus calyciflorus TaxID=104777 RepID=A0A813MIY1_9BILA|nr:unnamed protein product [Brachionus calyciflorus]